MSGLVIDPSQVANAQTLADVVRETATALEETRRWSETIETQLKSKAILFEKVALPGVVQLAAALGVVRGRGVYLDVPSNRVKFCDPYDITQAGKCIGVSLNTAYEDGQKVDVVYHGEAILPGHGFERGVRYYVGAGGELTSTPPLDALWRQAVGIGESEDTLLVDVAAGASETGDVLNATFAGSVSLILPAGEVIGYPRAVAVGPGGAALLYDPTDETFMACGVGVTQTSASQVLDPVTVILAGILRGNGWGFVSGAKYFIGPDGLLTLDPPAQGIYLPVGKGAPDDTLIVQPDTPIWRE